MSEEEEGGEGTIKVRLMPEANEELLKNVFEDPSGEAGASAVQGLADWIFVLALRLGQHDQQDPVLDVLGCVAGKIWNTHPAFIPQPRQEEE